MENKDTASKEKKLKQKMKRRTKFTILAIFNIIWYTVVVLGLSFFEKTVPSELTVGWYSAWTVELGLLFGIKVRSKDATDDGGEEYDLLEKEDNKKDKVDDPPKQDENNTNLNYDDGVG